MCTSAYSFGTGEGRFAGKSAKVTLILEQIHEVLDVSIGGAQERNVMKKRLVEGEGTEKPHDLAKVTLSVESVVANGERIMEGRLPREIEFEAGSGEVCDALEGACLEMRLNEVALVRCEKADTCAGGLLALPERLDVPVLIQCKMLRFQRVLDKLDMKDFQRIDRCRERKSSSEDASDLPPTITSLSRTSSRRPSFSGVERTKTLARSSVGFLDSIRQCAC